MNLEVSVEKLYETGWQPETFLTNPAAIAQAGLEQLPDGRLYPSVLKVQQLFAAAGYDLAIRYVQLFDCYRAAWMDKQGNALGAVVGSSDREAAVYALAAFRAAKTPVAAATTK